jgi:hypothetical protein
LQEKVGLAVQLAREAAGELERTDEPAVAFSIWAEATEVGFLEELADLVRAAEPDLVIVETMENHPGRPRVPGVRDPPRDRPPALGLLPLVPGWSLRPSRDRDRAGTGAPPNGQW